jgi:hypothetical protein
MLAAHIAGVPIEETLLSLGGPLAIYLAAVAIGLRATRRRIGALLRPRPQRGPGAQCDQVDLNR